MHGSSGKIFVAQRASNVSIAKNLPTHRLRKKKIELINKLKVSESIDPQSEGKEFQPLAYIVRLHFI